MRDWAEGLGREIRRTYRGVAPLFKEVAKNELIADAALAYCAAWIANRDADPANWLSARCELDRTLDALLTECGH